MKEKDMAQLAKRSDKIVLKASEALEKRLSVDPEEMNTKSARELTAIIRDMLAVSKDCEADKKRDVEVIIDAAHEALME